MDSHRAYLIGHNWIDLDKILINSVFGLMNFWLVWFLLFFKNETVVRIYILIDLQCFFYDVFPISIFSDIFPTIILSITRNTWYNQLLHLFQNKWLNFDIVYYSFDLLWPYFSTNIYMQILAYKMLFDLSRQVFSKYTIFLIFNNR
jgi:hypothetical protein